MIIGENRIKLINEVINKISRLIRFSRYHRAHLLATTRDVFALPSLGKRTSARALCACIYIRTRMPKCSFLRSIVINCVRHALMSETSYHGLTSQREAFMFSTVELVFVYLTVVFMYTVQTYKCTHTKLRMLTLIFKSYYNK